MNPTPDQKTSDKQLEAYHVALKEIGQKEVVGGQANPRILEYHKCTSLHATSDEVPWCSAFVNWCFQQVGVHGTNLALARSWLVFGDSVTYDSAREGDLVVFARGADPLSGHVGFIQSVYKYSLVVVGGNQKDMVSAVVFKRDNILGIRRFKTPELGPVA